MPSIGRRRSENSFLSFNDRDFGNYAHSGGKAIKMDAWEVFSELCKIVVESQNVYLDVLVTRNGIEFQLMPIGEEEGE